jgi:hypothetical protein
MKEMRAQGEELHKSNASAQHPTRRSWPWSCNATSRNSFCTLQEPIAAAVAAKAKLVTAPMPCPQLVIITLAPCSWSKGCLLPARSSGGRQRLVRTVEIGWLVTVVLVRKAKSNVIDPRISDGG